MTFHFSKNARRDLSRSLARTGPSREAVAEIERLTQRYHARFIENDIFPDTMFIGEARDLFDRTNAACNSLERASRRTRRRLEEEREYREEDMSLEEYLQAVNDVCMFAIHAKGDGDRPIRQRNSASDRALSRLTCDVATSWRKWTGCDLPKLPESAPTSWRALRTLQQHPLWIVYESLGIVLDAYAINELVAEYATETRVGAA